MIELVQDLSMPAIVSGAIAIFCLVTSLFFRSRRTILSVQFVALAAFTAHYLALGLEVAALANALGAIQVGAAIFAASNANLRRLGYSLIGLMVVLSIW